MPNYPYPAYPPPPQAAEKRNNTVGLIALVVSVIGLVFACVPGALIVGWGLLPAAFILGIVGLFLAGKAEGGGRIDHRTKQVVKWTIQKGRR